jgi:hypothetical protein
MNGFGNSVPPSTEHVIIYFLQKDSSQAEATAFYDHHKKRKWMNRRHQKISNWKICAWDWILKHSEMEAISNS